MSSRSRYAGDIIVKCIVTGMKRLGGRSSDSIRPALESQGFSCRCLRLSRAVGSGDPSSHPDGAQKVVANVLVERHQAMALAVEAQGPKRLG
jgi:hypothetical protein